MTRAKVAVRLHRMASGNLSDSKSVGGGVIELRVDTGPGYRIYYGRVGDRIVILLLGGTKAGQKRGIETARRFWDDYRERSSAT